MPATPAWLASAEALLNRCVDASPQAAAIARRLQDTSLQIEIEGMTRVRAAVAGARLMLLTGNDTTAAQTSATPAAATPLTEILSREADATISGSPLALWQLLAGNANREGAAPGRPAQIRGNAEIANLYRQLFVLARPDPEEELSRWIGDFPARRLSQFAHDTLALARRIRTTAGANIAEYLQEESRDLVNKTELGEFLRGVDEARETADRIEARLVRLEKRLSGDA